MPYGGFGFPGPDKWGKGVKKALGSLDAPGSFTPGGGSLGDLAKLLKSFHAPKGFKWQSVGGNPAGFGGNNNLTGSLLEGALAGAGSGGAAGHKKKQRGNYMSPDQELLAQLDALMNSNMGGLGPEDLQAALSEAAGGIRQAYGSQIGSIRHQMQGARADTAHGSKEIRTMYKALAKDYRKGAKREARQGTKEAKVLQNLGKNQAADINEGTGKTLDKLAEIAGGLGAPSIMEATAPGVTDQGQMLSRMARNEGTRNATMAKEISGGERRYINSQAGNSMLEGTNRAADLFSELQDFLQANRDKIGEIAGQRAQALAAAKNAIQGDFAKAQQDQMQQLIDNKMALAKLRNDMMDSKFDKKLALRKLAQSGAGGAAEDPFAMFSKQSAGPMALLSKMGDPTVNKLYNSMSDNTSMKTGYYDDNGDANNRVLLQDNYAGMMDYVQERIGPQWNQLSSAQRTALLNALLLQLQGGNYSLPRN